jgi:hypothetical protein
MKIQYLFPVLCVSLTGCIEHDYPNSHYGVDRAGNVDTHTCMRHDAITNDPYTTWHDVYYTGTCNMSDNCRWHESYYDSVGNMHAGFYEGDCHSDGGISHYQDNVADQKPKKNYGQ